MDRVAIVINIIFICHGDIYRSSTAEIIFKDMTKQIFQVPQIQNGIANLVYPPAKAVRYCYNFNTNKSKGDYQNDKQAAFGNDRFIQR